MLSIIIPTLNEEQHIEKLLHQLEAQKSLSFEIIVSDGGSADATLKIAKNMGAIIVSGLWVGGGLVRLYIYISSVSSV